MAVTGTLTGTAAPIGYFERTGTETWRDNFGNEIIGDDSANTATIEDGTDVIATYATTYTIAPVGTFTSTTYGEDTYNGGTPFTLTSTYENGGALSVALVEVFTGTAQAGNYTELAFSTWENGLWQIDGFAGEINDGTSVVAESGQSARDPTGAYASTTYGATTYNNGANFVMNVRFLGRFPIAGYVYVEIVLAAGVFSTARGPYFAGSLPANSSTLEVVPIAYSNGGGIVTQFVNGAILYR
jgi:hypothetical protein